ncbi:MAG: pyrroline-5-carboxylate reductase, partial [Deltaproteobacteria bacterium]
MLLEKKLGFIGTGNMGEALVKGLLKAGAVRAEQVIGSEPRAERREEIAAAYGIRVTADNLEVVRASEIVVLSIKPQIMERVLDEIRCAVTPEKLVISIAAGISIASIEERLPPDVHVIRVMPNTPALVQAGATVIAPGEHATETDLALARAIFDAVSQTFILDESQMDAVTGLSGSGPAYIFLIIEALADAGVKVGL